MPDPGAGGAAPPAATAPATTPAPATAPAAAPTATAPAAATTPAPAAGAEAPAPTAAPASSSSSGGGAYTVRLHDLERRTDELKEAVYRSKARLNLLKEMVLHQGSAVGRALIAHRNEMGATYTLIKLSYALDGAEIFSKADDSGKLGDTKEFEVFNGALVPGNHTLSVVMIYRGNGFGVFNYLNGYQFNVKSSHTFTAAEGKQTQLKVVGFEKGNPITTDPKDRPAVDFRLNVIADKPQGEVKPADPTSPPPAPASSDAGK